MLFSLFWGWPVYDRNMFVGKKAHMCVYIYRCDYQRKFEGTSMLRTFMMAKNVRIKEWIEWIEWIDLNELNWIELSWIEYNWIELNCWIHLNWITLNLSWTDLNWIEWMNLKRKSRTNASFSHLPLSDFEGSLAQNAFLRVSSCMACCVLPDKTCGMQWAISKGSCDAMRSDEIRKDTKFKRHGIRLKVESLLLRSTGVLSVICRHSLCSAL